jgi:uncharacterized membrane protein YbaN (DUF454 family)
MAVAGAILPGIPSLPFVLLATRHAVRLSPRMKRFLKRRRWTAMLLTQAETSLGLPKLSARLALKLIPIIALAAVAFAIIQPPMAVMVALEIGVMALVSVREIGSLSERQLAAPFANVPG